MKKMTKEEWRAKRQAEKAAFEAEKKWFDYKMHICCSEDYSVVEGYHDYIVYFICGTDHKYHVDLRNGMKFTCTEYKEISEIIWNFA